MVDTSISARVRRRTRKQRRSGQNKFGSRGAKSSLLFERLTRVSLSSLSSILGLSSWQSDGDLLEQTLDVVTSLGGSLDGKDVELLRLLVELLGRDLPGRDEKSKGKVRRSL